MQAAVHWTKSINLLFFADWVIDTDTPDWKWFLTLFCFVIMGMMVHICPMILCKLTGKGECGEGEEHGENLIKD